MKKAIMTVLALALMFSLAASGSDEVVTDRKPIAGIEIPITDIDPLIIGQVENKEAGTGCTVMICKDGMRAGLDVLLA